MHRALSLPTLMAAVGLAGSAVLAAPPAPVSPVGPVAQSCPTFSWSAVAGAPAYGLVVYRVTGEGEVGKEPLVSARLPAGAAVWTPSGADCLAPGGRYAWVLRVPGEAGAGAWSEPALFEVAAAPSRDEVQAAIATLRRHLAAARGGDDAAPPAAEDGRDPGGVETRRHPGTRPGAPLVQELDRRWRERTRLYPEPEVGSASFAPAAVPSLGAPSLSLDANLALGAASNLFKDGSVFLWDDTAGNTALGRAALASATGTATGNTAVGWETLRYTVAGGLATEGSTNAGVGFRVLKNNTTGSANTAGGSGALYLNGAGSGGTALGSRALFSNTTGTGNTAVGGYGLYPNTEGSYNTLNGDMSLLENLTGSHNTGEGSFALMQTTASGNTGLGIGALQNNTTGTGNVAIGYAAGLYATTGSDNVFILSYGTASDSGTIRVGTEGTQTGTFVAGIRGTTTANDDAVAVVLDSAGQLGTVSSSRTVKQDVRDVGELSRRLLELRPVTFRYRDQVARDPEASLQFGLLAEEVAEVFPELAVLGPDGEPQTVRYHLLPPLLLHEMQRLHGKLAERRTEIDALRDRVGAEERAPPPARRKVPWWRRLFGIRDAPE